MLLSGRRIALGVSSSISIYKAPEIVRLLQKEGASVRVVMSEESKKFISPLVFEALTKTRVLSADTESWASEENHIALASWAELFLVAPATANTINKLANGIADNLLLSSFLAFSGAKILAPAMNTKMLENPLTQESLQKLNKLGVDIVSPVVKELACGDVGSGALEEPREICEHVFRTLLRESFWIGRSVVVSGGGSREMIDSVRFLSNRSSGKMAQSLVRALYYLGADVSLVTSVKSEHLPCGVTTILVGDAASYMLELSSWQESHRNDERTPYIYMAAAISDYESAHISDGKLKKENLGEVWQLELRRGVDILQSLKKEGFKTIGFKLEESGEAARKSAILARKNKGVDAICLNVIGDQNPMESENNEVIFIDSSREITIPRADKLNVAFEILRASEEL